MTHLGVAVVAPVVRIVRAVPIDVGATLPTGLCGKYTALSIRCSRFFAIAIR